MQTVCLLYDLWRKAETAGTDRPREQEAQGLFISVCKNLMKGSEEDNQPSSGFVPSRCRVLPTLLNFTNPPSFPISTASWGPSCWQCNSVMHQLLLSSFGSAAACWGCALSHDAINGETEQYWHKILRSGLLQPWLFPAGICAAAHSPLSTAVKPVLEPPYSSLRSSVSDFLWGCCLFE